MRVVIAGGHGKIALLLGGLLAAREDQPVGLIRNPEHDNDLSMAGIWPVVFDLETDSVDRLADILGGADAVVFAAGAGPGSGVERKDSVDRAGAVLLAEAAVRASISRYLIVSAIDVDLGPQDSHDEVYAAYTRAKSAADDAVRATDLAWTVLRPGRLTDGEPTGRVGLAEDVERGEVTRADVAAVLLALLDQPRTAGLSLDLVAGATPIPDAVAALIAS